ncbi:unnamed protein product [Fusarium venenatum]|uniref:Cytochrome P450 n=1 Tax=Fusarium venenatum TaxID=56646 RepID=A0A2L2TWV7_9HYPO|nr:uncharacterized protein FVRRES_02772 [Fusarium venenatum]CEI66260.1 unnamed protein product [Fusarium venenatum]
MLPHHLEFPKKHEIVILFLALILLNLLGAILYNVFFHPLAKIPGPLACKITRIWLYLAERGGDGANTVSVLHKRYDPTFYDAFKSDHGMLFSFSGVDEHSKRKRLMSPSFSRASEEEHDAILHETIKPVVEELTTSIRKGETIALFPVIRRFALKSIVAFCYGQNPVSPDYMESVIPKLFKVLDESPKALLTLQHFPLIKKTLNHLSATFPTLFPSDIRILPTVGMELLQSSRKSSVQSGLFKQMQSLLKAKDQSLTDGELIAESGTMFFAGTDTTAITVSFALWYLMHQPDNYVRLQDELKTVMPDVNSKASLRELESLPFLEACIKESLRLACPPRGRLPRIVPAEGWEVKGTKLPAGTVVSSCISYIAHDEEIFPEPKKYRPERWLQENSKELEGYFYPFSRGTRSCIGQSLSLAEQRVAIAQVVRRFSPSKDMQFRDIIGSEYVTFVMQDELPVQLEEAR